MATFQGTLRKVVSVSARAPSVMADCSAAAINLRPMPRRCCCSWTAICQMCRASEVISPLRKAATPHPSTSATNEMPFPIRAVLLFRLNSIFGNPLQPRPQPKDFTGATLDFRQQADVVLGCRSDKDHAAAYALESSNARSVRKDRRLKATGTMSSR